MAGETAPGPLDDHVVADLLRVIAYPVRLRILMQLKEPRSLAEIDVHAERDGPGVEHHRKAAKQTVHEHLKKMEKAGLVKTEREGAKVLYMANPVLLYAVIQRLRLAMLRSWSPAAGADETILYEDVVHSERPEGAHLALVHGIGEGRCFPLDGEGPFIIGRGTSSDVTLDYDLYVSRQAAEISRGADGFVLRDLGSSSGISVNWVSVAPDQEILLRAGDIIGAGGSLLLYRGA